MKSNKEKDKENMILNRSFYSIAVPMSMNLKRQNRTQTQFDE